MNYFISICLLGSLLILPTAGTAALDDTRPALATPTPMQSAPGAPSPGAVPPSQTPGFDPSQFGEISTATLPLENGERLVMRVNGQPVTWQDFSIHARMAGATMLTENPGEQAGIMAALTLPVMDALITQELYREVAANHRLDVHPSEIERRTTAFIESRDPDVRRTIAPLAGEEIQQVVTDTLVREKVMKFVGDRATSAPPTLEEITDFIATAKLTTSPMQLTRARHIVFRATPDMSEFNINDAMARAEEVLAKIRTAHPKAASAIETTQTSRPVTSTTKHTVTSRTPDAAYTTATAQASVVAETTVTEVAVKEGATGDVEQSNTINFADFARQYSQDRFTAYQGGNIGYYAPGQMYEAFEAAAAKLAPGEISGVVRTPVGFHIIQVTERHNDDLRLQVEQHKRRVAVQQWLKQAEQDAAVERFLGE